MGVWEGMISGRSRDECVGVAVQQQRTKSLRGGTGSSSSYIATLLLLLHSLIHPARHTTRKHARARL